MVEVKVYLKYIILFVIVAALLCGTYFGVMKWRHENTEPYDYVQEYYKEKNEIKELICERKLDESSYLYFLYNKRDRISCLIVKKEILRYKIITEQNVELNSILNKEYIGLNFMTYRKSEYNPNIKWIAWNIVDKDIKTVWIDNQVANLIEFNGGSYKLCYLIGDGTRTDVPTIKID
ncbi:hypothetical protein NDGK_01930 [Clostridiales bacterium CHKCI001]|nr:hypothetical protein NDGK_01930 [Clostridiales bacterium CHKCI001]